MIIMITKIEDVASFAKYLIHEEKLSVHPDDNFFEYENIITQFSVKSADFIQNNRKRKKIKILFK